MSQAEVSHFPFFQGDYSSGNIGRLHFMWGNLSRVDHRLDQPDGKPTCNWFDPRKDPVFISRADKLPTYGASYMHLFMKIAKGWGPFGRELRSIKNARAVDEMLERKMTM